SRPGVRGGPGRVGADVAGAVVVDRLMDNLLPERRAGAVGCAGPGGAPGRGRHRLARRGRQKAPWISASLMNCSHAASADSWPASYACSAGSIARSFTAWCFGPRWIFWSFDTLSPKILPVGALLK